MSALLVSLIWLAVVLVGLGISLLCVAYLIILIIR